MRISGVCVFLLAAYCIHANAAPPVEPRDLASIEEKDRTQILILGSPHLSVLKEDFNPKAAEPLLKRLRAFAPDAVAVEALSPAVIRSMQAHGDTYAIALSSFAAVVPWGEKARAALGISYDDVVARTAALAEKAKKGGAYDHRALAMHFLAMNDLASAVLQWSYLDDTGRQGGKDVPEEIAGFLSKRLVRANEIYALAVPLARALGHVRIASIDDHSETDVSATIWEQLIQEMSDHPEASKVGSAPVYQKADKALAEANGKGDLTPAYRLYNSPDYARGDVKAQWDLFLRTRFESGVDRMRLALWDVRNLMTAAHIRKLSAQYPGGRILVIIGAAHKPFLDDTLRRSMDVRVVDAEAVLGKEG